MAKESPTVEEIRQIAQGGTIYAQPPADTEPADTGHTDLPVHSASDSGTATANDLQKQLQEKAEQDREHRRQAELAAEKHAPTGS